MKKTAQAPARKKAKRPVKRGYMGSSETVPLAIAARAAFDFQRDLGNIDDGAGFESWRHAEVFAVVGRDGLRDCLHEHFQTLMQHFHALAGRDVESVEAGLKSGPKAEQCRQKAHQIMEVLRAHIWLADSPESEFLAKIPAKDPERADFIRRRSAVQSHPKGPLREGYLVYIARSKSKRPTLNLGRDLETGLADRFREPADLEQIRDTLANRIAEREGRADRGRNSKQRSAAAKAARSTSELAPRFDLPDDPSPF